MKHASATERKASFIWTPPPTDPAIVSGQKQMSRLHIRFSSGDEIWEESEMLPKPQSLHRYHAFRASKTPLQLRECRPPTVSNAPEMASAVNGRRFFASARPFQSSPALANALERDSSSV